MKLRAPAKVNLHLRVLGRREDGFHDLETLMVPLSLADEITIDISSANGIRLNCDQPDIPLGEDNLVVKAARLFEEETGRKFSAEITLKKNIPMGAGLAGGSSDAAAVLRGLDILLETGLGTEKLETLAAWLGSDVAFFIRGEAAWCRGRGELIAPFSLPEKLPLLLVKPPFGVSTPWAYQHWAGSQSLPGDYEREQSLGWVTVVNSLERPVFEKFLLLPVLKEWLLARPETRAAAMSGSGSTLFAILKPEADGAQLAARVKENFGSELWTSVCETL